MQDVGNTTRTNLLQVDIVGELHVLRVNTKDLKTASRVGNTNVNLAVEATEAAEGGVYGVGTVSRGHNHDI